MINFFNHVLLQRKYSLKLQSPKVPQVAFTSRQSCQGGEDLFKNELPVLLITREHLRKSKAQTLNQNTTIQTVFLKKQSEAIAKLCAKRTKLHALEYLLQSLV